MTLSDFIPEWLKLSSSKEKVEVADVKISSSLEPQVVVKPIIASTTEMVDLDMPAQDTAPPEEIIYDDPPPIKTTIIEEGVCAPLPNIEIQITEEK